MKKKKNASCLPIMSKLEKLKRLVSESDAAQSLLKKGSRQVKQVRKAWPKAQLQGDPRDEDPS